MRDEWQRFPNELWAWEFFPVAVVHGRYVSRLWVPKVRQLLPAMSQLIQYNFKLLPLEQRQARIRQVQGSPLVATSKTGRKPTVVSACAADIGVGLLQYLRSTDDRGLCRICRLVCRDWARQAAVGDPERCSWKVQAGIVWH